MISTARAELPKAVLDQLKRATVMVKVKARDGRFSSGSGFFIKENLIVTNAHVLRAQDPWEKIESDVQVIFASGSADQKILRCRVSSVDVPRDIAFLSLIDDIKGPSIPFVKSDSLVESTPIYVIGFPLGEGLAFAGESPAPTVVSGNVSAFRRDRSGSMDAIQLNATLIPGNSGGPVVDGKGHLVGISRATLSNTKIGFAIPSDHAAEALAGRVTAAAVTVLREKSEIEIKLRVVDPLKQMNRMAAYYWTSDKGVQLPLATGTQLHTHGAPGDSPRLYSELKIDQDTEDLWIGNVPNVEVPETRELWLQFAMANGKQVRLLEPICPTRDVRTQESKIEHQSDSLKSPQLKQFESRVKDSSPFAVEPEVEPIKFAERITGLADSSNTLKSTAINVKLSGQRLREIVAAPQGHCIYAILEHDSHVWVMDSGSLATQSKILVAESPVSLGQYRDKLAVACHESQSIQVIDTKNQEIVHTLRISDKELFPFRIIGTAPDGSLMTLWRRNQDAKNLSSLYLLDLDKKRPPLKLVEASMEWCAMLPGKDKFVVQTQEAVPDIVPGRPYLLSIADDPVHSEIKVSGKFLNFMTSRRCYFSAPSNLLLIPSETLMDGKFQRITIRKNLESNIDSTYVPGHVLPQLGPQGQLVSVDWTQDGTTVQAIVQVADVTSNQIRKTIRIDGLPNALMIGASRFSTKPDMIYVTGRELLVAFCDDILGTIYVAPCATPMD